MLTMGSEGIRPKRVRKLKVIEVKPRRRKLYWAGPVIAVLLALMFLMNTPGSVLALDNYTFGSETVNKGYSVLPGNKDAEDGSYNSLIESDQYADTNYSGSSESMTYGTTGGGSFPSALDTDDATRRNYIEANLAVANYIVYLWPSADSSVNWDTVYPASPTTHYTKVNQKTLGGDSDTTYVTTATTSDRDVFTIDDISTPSGSPTMVVQVWAYAKKGSGGSMNLNFGMVSGGTDYTVYSGTLTTSYVNYSKGWLIDPKDSGAWTVTKINALTSYMTTSDVTPVPYVTQLGFKVYVNYSTDYEMQGTIIYNSVLSTSQTTGYTVLCQGYRSASENFNIQVWNYTSGAWVTKTTVNSASDTNFNFNLLGWASNCERSSGNVVQIRLIDATGLDAVQDTLYLDLLKIERKELGYGLDVVLTSTTVAQYGNITLRIKGYTSAETFKVNVWNYTSSAYDLNKLTISSLSNAWQTTVDLCDGHHRSGTTVQIQFVDGTASTADQVRDTLFLDVAWVTRYHTDPSITKYGGSGLAINYGDTSYFWLNYSDYDNEAPSYVYTHIGSTDYSMNANNSYVQYTIGKSYYLTKTDVPVGNTTYYFKVKDANSADITTTPVAISVNTKPTLTLDGVTPTTGGAGTYTFFVTYTDADSNSPKYVKVNIDSSDYTMTYNGTGGGYHYDKSMSAGTVAYSFKTEDYRSGLVSTTPKNLIVHANPMISKDGAIPEWAHFGDPISFFMNYSDADNDAPSAGYPKLHINGADYTMTANDSYVQYTVGKSYHYEKSNLPSGAYYDYYFIAKDAYSGEITSTTKQVHVNNPPVLSQNTVVPLVANIGNETIFCVIYTDADNDAPPAGQPRVWYDILAGPHIMTKNNSGDTDYTDGVAYHFHATLPAGAYYYYFSAYDNWDDASNSPTTSKGLYINNPPSLSGFDRSPGDPVYTTTELNFTVTYYDQNNNASTGLKWREDGGATQNVSMIQVEPSDTTYTDGKAYYLLIYLMHGIHYYDFYASDQYGNCHGGTNSITISNRNPSITNGPGASVNEWRNTYWMYDFDTSDLDGDIIAFAFTGPGWLSINGISGLLNGTTSNIPGDYVVTIYANDSYGGTTNYPFTLHVLNRVPDITSSGNTTIQTGDHLAYHVIASDADGDSLTYALSSNASWATVSGAWVNGTAGAVGWYEMTVWANDSYGGSDYEHWHLTVTVGAVDQPPYFTSSPIESSYNHTNYLYDANGIDPESQFLTFTLYGNGTGWLSCGSANGTIWGYPTVLGWYYCNLSLSDGVNEVWQNWTLTITEPPLPAPPPAQMRLSLGIVLLAGLICAVVVIVWKGV